MKPVARRTFVPVGDAQYEFAQLLGGRVMRTAVGVVFAISVALSTYDSTLRADQEQSPSFPLAENMFGAEPSIVVRGPLWLDALQDAQTIPEPLIRRSSPVILTKASQGFVLPAVIGGIPQTAVDAYTRAADSLARNRSRCGLDWSVLAGIGRVESNHGRYGGARLFTDGTTRPVIRGIPIDGRPGVATISDSDDGRFDDDPVFDRAVGPMQFIPSTWRRYAADGNADGVMDPDNIYDAALAAGNYLCASGMDTRDPAQLALAIFTYNHSDQYVRTVMANAAAYRGGSVPVLTDPVSSAAMPSSPRPSSTGDKQAALAASVVLKDVRPPPSSRPVPVSPSNATTASPVPAAPAVPAAPVVPATPVAPIAPVVPAMPVAPPTSPAPITPVQPQPPACLILSWPHHHAPSTTMPFPTRIPMRADDDQTQCEPCSLIPCVVVTVTLPGKLVQAGS